MILAIRGLAIGDRWNPVDLGGVEPGRLKTSDRVAGWQHGRSLDRGDRGPGRHQEGAFSFPHYAFPDWDELASTATLRFRTEQEIRSSLQDAGFGIEQIFGGCNREPIGAETASYSYWPEPSPRRPEQLFSTHVRRRTKCHCAGAELKELRQSRNRH